MDVGTMCPALQPSQYLSAMSWLQSLSDVVRVFHE